MTTNAMTLGPALCALHEAWKQELFFASISQWAVGIVQGGKNDLLILKSGLSISC